MIPLSPWAAGALAYLPQILKSPLYTGNHLGIDYTGSLVATDCVWLVTQYDKNGHVLHGEWLLRQPGILKLVKKTLLGDSIQPRGQIGDRSLSH